MNTSVILLIPGPWEWIVILVIALLLFGGKKIPELMKGMGKGIRNFKEGMSDDDNEGKEDDDAGKSKELKNKK